MSVLTEAKTGSLRLVHSAPETESESVWFCGKCALQTDSAWLPTPNSRVCRRCGLGLLLEARADVCPQPSDAFLIVDATLSVQALSSGAERLLGLSEPDAINRPVAELLTPATSENPDTGGFVRSITDAATGLEDPQTVFLRPRNTFGVRMRTVIGACGPPRAALIVLKGCQPALRSI